MFSEVLLDHFQSPRHVGEVARANAAGADENPVCGDHLQLWLYIDRDRIKEAGWQANGCAPTIAVASATSEVLHGMRVEDARSLDPESIAQLVGGLPARKNHAVALFLSALQRALDAHSARGAGQPE